MKKSHCIHMALLLCFFILTTGCRTIDPLTPEVSQPTRTKEEFENNFAEFSKQPRQIGLLLPSSGKHAEAAKAVQEGFLASFYEATGRGNPKPAIRIYDTTKEDIQSLYEKAVREGAELIVGPLSKEEVFRVSQLPYSQLRIPVLALNYAPGVRAAKHFIQFSLAPESEAVQLAEKAWMNGHRSAGIIVPNNEWGKRVASTFSQNWQRLGGRTMQTVYVNPSQDQAEAVRRLLNIDESKKRANQLKSTEKTEVQPRRRQDLDVLIMAASPDQARQLKPLFDFYYAEDLPVYATSSIYNGNPNPKRDADLNGVIFCDMPWLLNQQQGKIVHLLLSRNASSQSDDYNRLFAMGMDAYQLSSHLNQLQNGGTYPGSTGNLSLGNNNQIQRDLAWAKMVGGLPVLIN